MSLSKLKSTFEDDATAALMNGRDHEKHLAAAHFLHGLQTFQGIMPSDFKLRKLLNLETCYAFSQWFGLGTAEKYFSVMTRAHFPRLPIAYPVDEFKAIAAAINKTPGRWQALIKRNKVKTDPVRSVVMVLDMSGLPYEAWLFWFWLCTDTSLTPAQFASRNKALALTRFRLEDIAHILSDGRLKAFPWGSAAAAIACCMLNERMAKTHKMEIKEEPKADGKKPSKGR